ncbi:MAG: hypothetical protein NZ576_05860 [Bacteroidia bacterium]|nr:hypothetical protein [Bacteroidia bacterium]
MLTWGVVLYSILNFLGEAGNIGHPDLYLPACFGLYFCYCLLTILATIVAFLDVELNLSKQSKAKKAKKVDRPHL